MSNYQLFADGTINVLVDGRVQRREYTVQKECGVGFGHVAQIEQIVPHTNENERIVRMVDGDIFIVSTGSTHETASD